MGSRAPVASERGELLLLIRRLCSRVNDFRSWRSAGAKIEEVGRWQKRVIESGTAATAGAGGGAGACAATLCGPR